MDEGTGRHGHVQHMFVRLEHVEDEVATREGMSLSDFLKKELARAAERPTMQEWLRRTQQGRPIRSKRSPAQVIRELRDSR